MRKLVISVFVFLSLLPLSSATMLHLSGMKNVMAPLHIIQGLLAVAVCIMSVKLFRITQPVKLFYMFYFAMALFIIHPIVYLQLSFMDIRSPAIYHIVGNVALIAMVATLGLLLSTIYRAMKKGV